MASPILVTGAAGRIGGVGRTITELLLRQGQMVRAMVRTEDERAQVLRDMGAEVVVGSLLDLDSMHRAIDQYWARVALARWEIGAIRILADEERTREIKRYHTTVQEYLFRSGSTISQEYRHPFDQWN